MLKMVFIAALSVLSASSLAAFSNLNDICKDTVLSSPGGQFYQSRTFFAFAEGLRVSAVKYPDRLDVKIESENSAPRSFELPDFPIVDIAIAEENLWVLSRSTLSEYSLGGTHLGTYQTLSIPSIDDLGLAQYARGFDRHEGMFYIAHGELGVSTFSIQHRMATSLFRAGTQSGSLASSVKVLGDQLLVLQGAFLPNGHNGFALYELRTGRTKLVSYPLQAGVVDPYTSNMQVHDNQVFVNNGGWIHLFSLNELIATESELAPRWLPDSELLTTHMGQREFFLSVFGDFVVSDGKVSGCSSVTYVPREASRPIREWRLFEAQF